MKFSSFDRKIGEQIFSSEAMNVTMVGDSVYGREFSKVKDL